MWGWYCAVCLSSSATQYHHKALIRSQHEHITADIVFPRTSRLPLEYHIPAVVLSLSACPLGCDRFCLSSLLLTFLKISEMSLHLRLLFSWQSLCTSGFLWWCWVPLKRMATLCMRPRWSISVDVCLMTGVSQCQTAFVTVVSSFPCHTLSSERDLLSPSLLSRQGEGTVQLHTLTGGGSTVNTRNSVHKIGRFLRLFIQSSFI